MPEETKSWAGSFGAKIAQAAAGVDQVKQQAGSDEGGE
jgi:hypothetical protein